METKVNFKESLEEIKRQVRKSVIDQLYEGCTSIYFEEFINQFYIYIDGMDLEYFYKVVDLNETEWDEIPIFVTDNGGEPEIEFCLSDDYIDECKENGIEPETLTDDVINKFKEDVNLIIKEEIKNYNIEKEPETKWMSW